MSKIIDELKRAIEASGKSRYLIAQESGIAESALSRLMSGERGLSLDAAQRLAAYLGLDIVVRPTKRKGR